MQRALIEGLSEVVGADLDKYWALHVMHQLPAAQSYSKLHQFFIQPTHTPWSISSFAV